MYRFIKISAFIVLLFVIAGFILTNYRQAKGLVLKAVPSENVLRQGEIGSIELKEMQSPDYKWYFEIKDSTIIKLYQGYVINYISKTPKTNVIHTWEYKALKSGKTTIIYKYCNISDPSKVEQTIEYNITVK